MNHTARPSAGRIIGQIEAARALDRPGYAIGNALARAVQIAGRPAERLRNALHGAQYGHPTHPMLVTIPIGTWSLALGLDLLAALGLVHDHSAGQAAKAAIKAGTAGAVIAQENRPRRVEVWDEIRRQGVGIALVRQGDRVHAIGARCSHAGGHLDEGWVLEGTLVCPWHGSRYDLATGQPVSGPSTCPQPRYLTRVRNGMVEVKREQEAGDDVVTTEALAAIQVEPQPPEAEEPGAAKKADEVLIEHHQLLRRLFQRIEAMAANDPERRDLMRTLASELEIHEYVEDRCFYPAVRPVSEDVAVARAEHRQLADLLATTLKLNTSSPEFNEHLQALRAAVEHHAGSEERSMFREIQRLGEPCLRAIGHQLSMLLEKERTSRFRRAFRDLKITLLEGL